MGDAVIQAFGADPLTAVNEMSIYYPINDIKTWLIRKHGLDAPQMVEVMMGLPKGVGLDPINTVPALLKDDFGITSAIDAAKVMYDAGWTEDEITSCSYWRVLKLLKDDFSCTPSDLIDIMKELGLSPLTVAQQMDAFKTHSDISSWMPEYKAQGYTASDLAAWRRTIDYDENVDQAVIVLGNAGYNLDEITAALKQVYELDANDALTILKYQHFTLDYKWWTEAEATAAVELAYNVNTLETVIGQMETNDATAAQIANTLKETFAVSEPGNVAEYLIQLGYGKSDVLTALALSFRTLKNAELIQMFSQVLREKFSEEPMDNMELILSLYENVKGSLNHAMNGVILMHESGFELSDITLMLQNDFDALQNVANLTAFDAGKLLLRLKAYGLTYDKLDVFAVIKEVYGVNFMLETVIDFKNNEKYTAETAITKLIDDFDVDTPSAAALCLKDAGYTMPEVLEGLADRNRLEKKLVIIELLRQVIKDVYPEEQAPMKVIMEAMGVENSGLASETLYRAGYSMSEIIKVLLNDYKLSSGQATELLYERKFEDIVVSVEDVYGGNGYLDFVLYRKSQGDSITQLFDWLYERLGVKDAGQIVNTLKLAGYESEHVITLLYTKRKEVVEGAILTVLQVFGEGSIQDYIGHRKSQGDNIAMIFKWMQTLGVKDINEITNYLYAAGYTSNELIEFLLSPAVQHENNYTVNVEEEYGDETVVNFLKEKKEGGGDIGAIYTLLTDQFAVSDLTQIVHYLKETGFSSNEIIAFVYMGSVNFNEQLISSSENDYGDNSIKELLAYRKSQGDGLAQLYTLLTQLDITETRQVTAYFQSAGFSGAEISQFFNEREISQGRQLIDLIQSVYEGDVISDYILGIQSDGTSALKCSRTLTDRFGIKDINQVIQYLNNGGYEDVEIVEAIDYQLHARRGIATLKTIYSTETPAQLINRLLATSLKSYYSVHDIVCSAKEAFPDTKHSEIILAIKNVGGKMNQIVNWLIYVNNNVSYKSFYLGLSREELDDLASILGSRNEYDLNLDTNDASYILFEFGYNLQEAIVRAKNANFSNYDVFMIAYQIIGDQGGGPRGLENHKALSAMEKEGYSINELAAVIVKYHRRHVDPNAGWDPNARENPYQTAYLGMMDLAGFGKPLPEVVAALIDAGVGPRYMINALHGYWYDRYYFKDPFHPDPMRYDSHYSHTSEEFSPLNIVTWIYNGVENLPEEKRSVINMVEEAAAGFYTISNVVGAEYSKVFDAMMYVTGKMSVGWRGKIPQSDIDAIDDLINTIASLISFPGQGVNKVLDRVLVVNAMRTAGYDNDEATALLKSVVEENYIMNFAMQAMGGYNAKDSWDAVMRVDVYRNLVGINVLWFIASNAYRLDAYYKVIKDVKKNYDRIKKICMFLIDHGVLGTAPAGMTLAANGGFSERMVFAANSGFSDEMLFQSYRVFSEAFDNEGLPITMSSSSTSAEISDVTLVAEENSTVTIRGTISSGTNTELLLLMKKPDVSGNSQKDAQLNSLTDQELKGIIDYLGCTSSTESVELDGASHNFELRYRSDGKPGEYAVLIGTAGAVEAYTTESTLFAKTLAGKVSITGIAKIGEILTADISELTNAVGTLTYQWYRAEHPIDGANSNTYTLVKEDNGKTITVKVTADGIYATGSVISAATEEVTGVYTVSVGVITGGAITASPTTAVAGETITLTITPDEGMRLKAGSLKYNDGTEDHAISGTSFTMPAANVTVTAEFEAIPPGSHTVSVSASPDESGTVSGGGIYTEGASVEVTATPNLGYTFIRWTDKESISVTEAVYCFTMGIQDISLTAEFELIPAEAYIVSVGTLTGGTISVSPTTATSGDAITLTITPDMGKQLKAGSLKYNDGTEDHIISGTSFTMPAANVTVTAEFEDVSTPVTDHDKVMADIAALSIGYAPGDSAAAVTQNVNLTVTGAVYGSNIAWKSRKTTVISDNGVVTRPDFASGNTPVHITATVNNKSASSTKDFILVVLKLPQITYTVTFDKNGGDTEASPATIKVVSGGNAGKLPMAPTRSGYTFDGWNTKINGTGITFTANTAITGSIKVYAQWRRNSSDEGGDTPGGGGETPGGGGETPSDIVETTTPAEAPKTETTIVGNTVTATTTITAVVDSSGNAAALVSQEQVSDAISKAMEEAKKQGEGTVARVEFKVETPSDTTVATTTEASLPEGAVNQTLEAGVGSLTISTSVASITFDTNSLSSLSREVTGELKITASKLKVASLAPETQRVVGDRPVFGFTVTIGDTTISQFDGEVTVSVPYTQKEDEDINAIVIYYINDSGELELVNNCIYNPETGMITFSTRHFSKYAVGYNKVSFKDVAENEWYGKAVGFIAAREITTGTGSGNFSPEEKLTRGQFIVMLMRAYGIAPETSSKDNFADAGNTYYTGYLAAAKRLSISNGVGNNMFAPENEITRQEMFTLLYNALKVIGRLPKETVGKPLSTFADVESIASWAKEAMTLMVETGTISGNGGKLSPTSTTTRAEMAQVLYSLLSR